MAFENLVRSGEDHLAGGGSLAFLNSGNLAEFKTLQKWGKFINELNEEDNNKTNNFSVHLNLSKAMEEVDSESSDLNKPGCSKDVSRSCKIEVSKVNIKTEEGAEENKKRKHEQIDDESLLDVGSETENIEERFKAIPIHVIIETIPLPEGVGATVGDSRPRVENDSYALIPAHAKFDDLLHIVLIKTGYTEDMNYARGLLQLRHWRGVPLEQVAADGDTTVGEVLGELAALATLHVRIYSSPRVRTARTIRERVLRVLLTQSQHIFTSAGCPLSEAQLAALVRGSSDHHLPDESLRQFETWWALQIAHATARHPPPTSAPPPPLPHLTSHHPTSTHLHSSSQSPHLHTNSPHPLHHANSPHNNHQIPSVTSAGSVLHANGIHPMGHNDSKGLHEPLHPALQGMANSMLSLPKTRMRTSFDPEYELPRLQRWFAENQHPTRHQIQQYVSELNLLESRRGRKPLDINNVVYWFKNARAAHKRQEYRVANGMKSPPPEDISDSEDFHSNHSINVANLQHNHHGQTPISTFGSINGLSISRTNTPQLLNHSSPNNLLSSNINSSPVSTSVTPSSQPLNLHNNNNNSINSSNKENCDSVNNNTVAKEEKGEETKELTNTNTDEEVTSGGTNIKAENLSTKRKLEEDDEKTTLVKEESMADSTMTASPTPLSPSASSTTTHTNNPSPTSTQPTPVSGVTSVNGSHYAGGSQNNHDTTTEDSPLNSDVDMSDDEEGRSRDSVVVTDDKNFSPPLISPNNGTLGFSSYPQLSSLSQGSVDRFNQSASSYPVMPTNLLQQSMMYMAHYMPQVPPFPGSLMPHGSIPEERRKRNRTFIDPVTEVPRLEQWFTLNTHPSHNLIMKYTEELNRMPYRQKFPRLEPKNVQFWFKNRRAKCKRLRVSM